MRQWRTTALVGVAGVALLWGTNPAGAGAAGPITSGPIIPNYDLPNTWLREREAGHELPTFQHARRSEVVTAELAV